VTTVSDKVSDPTETELDLLKVSRDGRPRTFLYLVLEADRPLVGGARFGLDDLDEVLVGRNEPSAGRQSERSIVGGKRRLTVRTSGSFLSKEHAAFRRTARGWEIEDLRSKNGVTVNGSTIQAPTLLRLGDLVSLGRLFFIIDSDVIEAVEDLSAEDVGAELAGFLTLIPGLGRRLKRLRQEAPRATAITLIGETGTGKEILAKAIHAASGRTGPYIGVNCGAIPRDLIQSELFGHLKGAFSGATDNRAGYLRDAHQGTLLLDEIVAAPEEVQVALLRAMQERAVTPIGGTRPQQVDVRFIAAAQKPLAEVVASGRFRADLRARIEAFRFELPPLRERTEDIGTFVASALRTLGLTEKDKPRLSPQAAVRLLRYDWPHNIRELAQAVHVAWGSALDGEIGEEDLPKPRAEEQAPQPRLKEQIVAHLKATRGNVAEAARRMGRSRFYMYEQIRKLDIKPESFRSG
jgi:pSer/pThr/pTyr-binding forkhead associated (FHA) protein